MVRWRRLSSCDGPSPGRGLVKQIPANLQRETAGVLAIHTYANTRAWIWRPTTPPDTGIDGTIEIAIASGPTGQQVAVQSKSGRSYIRSETARSFQLYATSDDIAYWESYSLPVLVCVYDPSDSALYAVSVKDYLRDFPETRARPHRFLFDKERDRVTTEAESWIQDVAFRRLRSYVGRRPLEITEWLHSNLLRVATTPASVFSAPVVRPFSRAVDQEAPLRPVFVEKEQRCWSFSDLESDATFDNHLDRQKVEQFPWEDMLGDGKRFSYLLELLYLCLRRHLKGLPIAFDRVKKRYYFLPNNGDRRRWQYKSQLRQAKRTVAAPFGHKGLWVHHAAKFGWQSLGNLMFLKIIPAYVFTEHGTAIKGDEDVIRLNVKKRKREYNKQVFQHLVFWREVLAKGTDRISLQTGGSAIVFEQTFLSQSASFGIPDDPGSFARLTEPMDEALDETGFEEEELEGGEGAIHAADEP